MTIRLNVVDREGQTHEIETRPQGSLMEALREFEYGVAAICGGMCSCATCHVQVAPEWVGKLQPPQSDENELISELTFRQASSRLSCQIPLSQDLDGLSVTIAPDE